MGIKEAFSKALLSGYQAVSKNEAAHKALKGFAEKLDQKGSLRGARVGIKKARRAQKIEEQSAVDAQMFAGTEGLTLQEAGVTMVDLPSSGKNTMLFDVLGQIDSLDGCDLEAYGDALSEVLYGEDVKLRLAIAPAGFTAANKEGVEALRASLNLRIMEPGNAVVFNQAGISMMVAAVEIPRDGEGTAVMDPALLRQIAAARNEDVDYKVVYLLRQSDPGLPATRFEKSHIRLLANAGVRYLFGSNVQGIYRIGDMRRVDRRYSHLVTSMGGFFGQQEQGAGRANASMAVRVQLLKNGTHVMTNSTYVPLFNVKGSGPCKNVLRIDSSNSEHMANPAIRGAYEYIGSRVGNLVDANDALTLSDILAVLGKEVPEEFAYLGRRNIGRVTGRSFEVQRNDVFFFMEPFQDPNDDEPLPMEQRLRRVDRVMRRGAMFVVSYTPLDPSIPHVVVENAREAHIQVCAELRKRYNLRTIGITGSIGKTSTKDMLLGVLQQRFEARSNTRNSNVQVTIGINIQNFHHEYDFYVQEIGGGRPGGASRHSRMVLPSAAVITNIGTAHIGNFGTQEKLLENKLGVADGLVEGGTLFLNGDDPLLWQAKPEVKTVYYALNNKEADYYADNIVSGDESVTFDIVHGDHVCPAKLNVLGDYNVLNAVCCYAIGTTFGMKDSQVCDGLLEFKPSGLRQNLVQVAGYTLFADCYNASVDSVESSLSVLDDLEVPGKKIAVIGDITGAGDLTGDVHEEVGAIVCRHKMDKLICYGEESEAAYAAAKAAGLNAVHITEPDALVACIKESLEPGDVILFKGSSKTRLSERIDELFGTCFSDLRSLDSMKYMRKRYSEVRYNVFETYCTVTAGKTGSEDFRIQGTIRGLPVYNIGEGAFRESEHLVNLMVPEPVRNLGANCCTDCGNLEEVHIPPTCKYISEEAFAKCCSLKVFEGGSGLMHIEDRAFAECELLEEIHLPESVLFIGKDAFADCDNLTVVCKEGSYAHEYCKLNSLSCRFE